MSRVQLFRNLKIATFLHENNIINFFFFAFSGIKCYYPRTNLAPFTCCLRLGVTQGWIFYKTGWFRPRQTGWFRHRCRNLPRLSGKLTLLAESVMSNSPLVIQQKTLKIVLSSSFFGNVGFFSFKKWQEVSKSPSDGFMLT